MSDIKALGLYSGGLDSLLACRIIMAQGIRVTALKFVTPFFDDALLGRREEFQTEVREKYGIHVRLVDLSDGYIDLLHNPAHGYGKNFNPCIDCKIFMLTRARRLMDELGASFLFTGEVLGQRPMSQRRDTLRVIERDSGCEDILLRPLCARRLPETRPEREGLVDRDKLYGFTGRGRRPQMELAEAFGITEYPAPAGGCILTDPNLGARIEQYYQGRSSALGGEFQADDIRLLLVGRQFMLPGGYWFVLGRNRRENDRIEKLVRSGDWVLRMVDRPGPTGLLRSPGVEPAVTGRAGGISAKAASLVARYARKINGRPAPGRVRLECGEISCSVAATPPDDRMLGAWQF